MTCAHCRSGDLWSTERRQWVPGWTTWRCSDCALLTHVRITDLPGGLAQLYTA